MKFKTRFIPERRLTGHPKSKWVPSNDFKIILNCLLIISLLFTSCSHPNKSLKAELGWEQYIDQERTAPGSISQVDDTVILFMKKYHVPGLSLAIAKGDKLIYVKGFGFADTSNREKVTPESLFRIASISKPFTSVAIMKLMQEGKLSMDSKVFGDSGILGNQYGTIPYGPNITNITIDELLHHTGGGWTNDYNDPMFSNPYYTPSQLITWTLNNQPLTNTPGSVYAYSNFGYFILGRVIEKLTGQTYADYVNKNILRPIGIHDMQIGGNTKDSGKPREVVYYGQGEDAYSFNVSRMDSHGGWIASATDLIKFIVKVDGFNQKAGILDGSTTKMMLTGSRANPKYACGWGYYDSQSSWGHGGSLPGTSTVLEHNKAGFSWAILINTRLMGGDFNSGFGKLIDNTIIDSSIKWPEKKNLF
jgi:D-alanyl-D-alanine carboxypeptidase